MTPAAFHNAMLTTVSAYGEALAETARERDRAVMTARVITEAAKRLLALHPGETHEPEVLELRALLAEMER